MYEARRDDGRETEPAQAPLNPALARPAVPLAMLASADVATRGRVLAQLQRSAGNHAVSAALLRNPAPPTAAPVPATGIVPMLAAFWPDTTWSQTRLALDIARIVPAVGLITGLGADLMGAWDDFAAVPTGNTMLAVLNYGLLGVRSTLNVVVNGAEGVLALTQAAQWAQAGIAAFEAMTGIGVPKAIVDFVGMVGAMAAGEGVGLFLAETDGVLALLDALITIQAGIWGAMAPVSPADRAKWKELAWGYLANTLGDIATLPVVGAGMASLNFLPSGAIAQAIDSLTLIAKNQQLAKRVITGLLRSFWNVRGGNVLPKIPGPGPPPPQGLDPRPDPPPPAEATPVLARATADPAEDPSWAVQLEAAQACYERGESVMGDAASGWAELLASAGAMVENAIGAPEALEALRAQLPQCAEMMQSRLATVEGLADQLSGGIETLDAFGGRIDELVATADAPIPALDDVPQELRSAIDPLIAAFEAAKPALLEPLRQLQGELAELRPQLEAAAEAAHDTVAVLQEGVERVAEAAASCDDISEFVNDLAALPAALATGQEAVSIDATLADWRTLGPDIAAARAAL
jgi:hypothetical protein